MVSLLVLSGTSPTADVCLPDVIWCILQNTASSYDIKHTHFFYTLKAISRCDWTTDGDWQNEWLARCLTEDEGIPFQFHRKLCVQVLHTTRVSSSLTTVKDDDISTDPSTLNEGTDGLSSTKGRRSCELNSREELKKVLAFDASESEFEYFMTIFASLQTICCCYCHCCRWCCYCYCCCCSSCSFDWSCWTVSVVACLLSHCWCGCRLLRLLVASCLVSWLKISDEDTHGFG